jgi:hypothetical protein
MLEVGFEGLNRIDAIGRKLRVATEKTMINLTDVLYAKVMENVSGKILQKQTGQLAGSIGKSYEAENDFYVGSVFVSPTTDKAWVLEKGGSSYYPIVATKASVLAFYTKSGEKVFRKSVMHPPSKKFAYLLEALEEMNELVPKGFRESIQAVIDGGDYGE